MTDYPSIDKTPLTTWLTVGAIAVLAVILLAGCWTPQSIARYYEIAPLISLGDSRDTVLQMLKPTEREWDPTIKRRQPEQYSSGGKAIYVYYARSAVFNDGITTDDEFTPYVFEDDELVAIGWEYLGGPKTRAEAFNTTVTVH